MHPPVGSAVLLDDPGNDSAVRPIKGTGCDAEEDQAESPTLAFRYASVPQAAPMTAVPYPADGPGGGPACASSCP
ncbi:hypothetical protein [Streptomyces olivaceoviridis]|uniref:hypothetical protein n=1 Tax=Streptomyces olivaceoviridis TaxID=1921 RepID=UPI0007185CF2|nr:hypothetical protein SHL15_8869 [Streptomyces hygroscopicus subsp. limoneus]